MEQLFMGQPAYYWLELKDWAERNSTPDFHTLLKDYTKLATKVRFYESRIGEITRFQAALKDSND